MDLSHRALCKASIGGVAAAATPSLAIAEILRLFNKLLQHSLGFRRRSETLVSGLIFLFIPYMVDVAFLGDFTPSHFAQENVVANEDFQDIDEKSPTLDISGSLINQYSDSSRLSNVPVNLPDSFFCPTPILTSASLVSRPPPASLS